jgi:ABC-type enterochelin transport system permease subunit
MRNQDHDLVIITPEEVKEAICEEVAAVFKKAYDVDIYKLDRDQLRAFLLKITAGKKTAKYTTIKWLLYKAAAAAAPRLIWPVFFYGLRSVALSHIF